MFSFQLEKNKSTKVNISSTSTKLTKLNENMNQTASILTKRPPSLFWSVRFLFTVLTGVYYAIILMQRTNMSFAVICMVNSSALLETDASFLNKTLVENKSNADCADLLSTKNSTGKFLWSKSDQGLIISAYFYGYMVTQILGGWCALKFGGLWVISVSMVISSILTMLTVPIANLDSIPFLFILRFLIGVFHGTSFPALSFLFVRWAPQEEKSTLIGFSTSGIQVGCIMSNLLGSYLCEYGFLEGWGSIFVLFGAFGIILVLLIIAMTSESPSSHRFISQKEKNFLMEKVSNLPRKKNGLNSSIPHLASFVFTLVGGLFSDWVIKYNILNRLNSRKFFNSFGLLVPMVCVLLLAFMADCTEPLVAVVLLSTGVGIISLGFSIGLFVNMIDISGKYVGVLYGISNTIGTIPGIVAPSLVGFLTPRGTKEEWQIVYVITAVIFLVGAVPYIFMAKGELQDWAKESYDEEEKIKLNNDKLSKT